MRSYCTVATPNATYLYDSTTNLIVRLTPAERVILDGIASGATDKDIAQELLSHGFSALPYDDIADFHGQCAALGLMRQQPLGSVEHGMTADQIRHQLAHHVHGLVLSITEQCSMRCRYCVYSGIYSGNRIHSERHMSAQTARAAIDFYLSHSSHEPHVALSFYGGEPLLRPAFIEEAIKYLQKRMLENGDKRPVLYNMTTNPKTSAFSDRDRTGLYRGDRNNHFGNSAGCVDTLGQL